MNESERQQKLAMAVSELNEAAKRSDAAKLRALAAGESRACGRGPELVRLAEVLGDFVALSKESDQPRG